LYIVIELQTDKDGKIAQIPTDHATKAEAESKYHQILAAAAISKVPIHAAVILTPEGVAQKSQCYKHDSE
jgi:hypothetical protein